MRNIRRMTWPALAGLGMVTIAGGCSDRAWLSEVAASDDAGSLGLGLQLDPNGALDFVHYELTGPNGYSLSGDIELSGSSRIIHVFERLAAGSYSVTLSGSGANGSLACTGSADFVIRAHATTSLTVNLQCRIDNRTGSIVINGALNVCPVIESLAAIPLTLTADETTKLNAFASDFDRVPETLRYSWHASGGTFSDSLTQSPLFTPDAVGPVNVTLTVSDGDCTDSWTVDLSVVPEVASSSGTDSRADSSSNSILGETSSEASEPASSASGAESTSLELDNGSGSVASSELLPVALPRLVASATAPRSVGAATTSLAIPDGVEKGDLAVAFLLTTGTSHSVTAAPAEFVTRDLAAVNHRLSYGVVVDNTALSWSLSANATTSATVLFFRGPQLKVHVAATGSVGGANFDVTHATNGPATAETQVGVALLSIQLPLNNTPIITAGPGGTWAAPAATDGVQLFTWHQPYTWDPSVAFALPGVTGSILSASATKHIAQVVVYAAGQ